MSEPSLKFLHFADLHLDRQMTGGKLSLPYDKVERRSRELRDALTRIVELAQTEKVKLIIISGDLWEEDVLSPDSVPFVFDTLEGAGLPVVIAPGNHDYHCPTSHYSNEITHARFGRKWPENVHVFRDDDFTHYTPPGLDGVVITGLAYGSPREISSRRLKEQIDPPEAEIRLCVIHGSRDDHLPSGKMRTLPFSDKEVLSQPFDYTALGHYHSRSTITDEHGQVRAAYPGSTCALTIDDNEPKGVLIGTVKPGGVVPSDLVFHEIDQRRIHRLKVDVSGLQHVQRVENRIEEVLKTSDVRPDDMALVKLDGTYPQGSRITIGDDFSANACFHLRVDTSAVLPEWKIEDDESLNPVTTEALFRVQMRMLIEEAKERDDQAEVDRIQNALFYGLDALHGRPITPRLTS